MVSRAADILKDLMVAEMRGKVIHAKIDSASRRGRSFFGINVQFADENNCIAVRHLALHEMIERQTKENLKAVMEHEFDKFKILRKQLLTVAHDNGANMVASVKLLKRLVDEGDDDHGPSVGSTVQKEKAMIDAYLNTCSNEDVEYDLDDENEQPWIDEGGEMSADDLDTDSDHDINDVNEVEDEEIIEMHLIESTRCAAHTAQLAVWDVLKQYKGRLAKINQVCIKMRHKEFQQLFHIHKYPLPPKVNETRWNVWYIVLKYLLDLRISPFLPTLEKTDASLDLSRQWLFIERFCTAFEPLFELTLRLQKDHVPLSQFYADWLICQAKLDGIKEGNVLAAKLLKTMQNRIRKLSSTKIFKASLYLDPRFNFIGSKRLSPDDKKEAQEYLLALDRQLNEITGTKLELDNSKENVSPQSNFVEDYLADFFDEDSSSSVYALPADDTLLIELIQLETREKVSITFRQSQSRFDEEVFDIVAYWNKRKFSNPRLHRLAMAVLSAPSTQVTVERLFSRTKFILTDTRMKLNDVTLKNLMLLKMNSVLLPKVAEILDNDFK
ncbi:zinc finger BED domain-containing protein 4-like [Aedes aegypti]|uniref:HAT C-terminal dimerisation domain-containing protein n=1 Tax=Aedes aegypti TaxID=7159 RepID=A0A6I8U8X0_AEDAE|nr:zinc finger BED domain-containing protein 4-like [Aedes aegypti]